MGGSQTCFTLKVTTAPTHSPTLSTHSCTLPNPFYPSLPYHTLLYSALPYFTLPYLNYLSTLPFPTMPDPTNLTLASFLPPVSYATLAPLNLASPTPPLPLSLPRHLRLTSQRDQMECCLRRPARAGPPLQNECLFLSLFFAPTAGTNANKHT